MGAYSNRVIADGASYYWRLGESSGLTAVDVVGGKNGTISGGVTLGQPGAIADGDKAMAFNGTTGQMVTPAVTCPVAYSLEAWIKGTPAVGAYAPIVSTRPGGGSIGLFVHNHALELYSDVAAGFGATPLDNGQWHHLVVTFTGTMMSIFVDGVLDRTDVFAHTLFTNVFRIGTDIPQAEFWPGSIDDVAIYPRALTPAEVVAHSTLGITPDVVARTTNDLNTGLYTYLLGALGVSAGTSYAERVKADGATNHWRLGETSGTTAVDAIGGANGTISGGVTLNQPSALADGNGAMLFNGTTGKIVTAAVTLPATVTVEAWLKGADANERPVVVLGSSQAPKFGTTANKLYFYDFTSGIGLTGATAMSPGWHHAVYVGDGAGVRLYLDGVLDGTVSGVRSAQSGVVGVGYDAAFAPADLRGFWLGSLDDVSIYPRALTANEIAAHQSLGRSGLSGGNDLTTLITRYLATLTGDMTARWKQMEKNAGF